MRSGRIYTRKAMYTTPKRFLLIALNSATVDEENGPSMVVHLVSLLCIRVFGEDGKC